MTDCTWVILTYQGLAHLQALLPTVAQAQAAAPQFRTDVLIVENGQDDGSRDYVSTHFPDYRFERSPVNEYLFAMNGFIAGLSSPFVFILNNDMKVQPDILLHTLPLLRANSDLFAVGCRELDWEGVEILNGIRVLKYQRGWAQNHWEAAPDEKVRYTLYAGGGSGVFHRARFVALGGFNRLYSPGYSEDTDLGHRAWRRGWPSVYQPRAIIHHREGGTFKQAFKSGKLTRQIYRNKILWLLRNVDDQRVRRDFFVMLPYRLAFGWRTSRNYWRSLWLSLPRMRHALRQRRTDPVATLGDDEIKKLIGCVYKPAEGKASLISP